MRSAREVEWNEKVRERGKEADGGWRREEVTRRRASGFIQSLAHLQLSSSFSALVSGPLLLVIYTSTQFWWPFWN